MKPETEDERRVEAKAADLRKSGAKSSMRDGPVELTRLRTVSLGSSAGVTGYVQYRVLVDAEKVRRVDAAEDKQLPGAVERLMKMNFRGRIPAGSKAFLAKTGTLNCYSGVCEFLIQP